MTKKTEVQYDWEADREFNRAYVECAYGVVGCYGNCRECERDARDLEAEEAAVERALEGLTGAALLAAIRALPQKDTVEVRVWPSGQWAWGGEEGWDFLGDDCLRLRIPETWTDEFIDRMVDAINR